MAPSPKLTEEKELKLDPPPGFQLPPLPGEPLPIRTFTSTYFDTADLRLARAGLTLRRRVENKQGLWQLKLPKGTFTRLEIEAPGGPSGPSDSLRGLLFGVLGGRPLQAVAKMRTRRTGMRVLSGFEPVAEVVLDTVSVYHDGRAARSFEEIEIELTGGSDRDLKRLSKQLVGAGAKPARDETPKLFRALGLSSRQFSEPDPTATDTQVLNAALSAQFLKLQTHDPGVRLGDDAEDLHQFRVAARRIREMLKTAGPLLDPVWAASLEEELKWVGKAMNEARDLDVMIFYLEQQRGSEPEDLISQAAAFVTSLEDRRDKRRKAVGETINSERYLNLINVLEAGVKQAPEAPGVAPSLKSLAGRRFIKLTKSMENLSENPHDDSIHQLRIRGKRARYATELASPKLGKRADAFVESAKAFQDLLGEFHDASVLASEVEEFARTQQDTKMMFVAGRLFDRQHARQKSAMEQLPKAWKRLHKEGRALWA